MITFEMQQLFVIIQITLLAVGFLATLFAWKFAHKAKKKSLKLRGDYVISLLCGNQTKGYFELRAINRKEHEVTIDALGITSDHKFLNLKEELGIGTITIPAGKNTKLAIEANRVYDLLHKLGNSDHYHLYAIDSSGELILGPAKHLAYQLYLIKDAKPVVEECKEPEEESSFMEEKEPQSTDQPILASETETPILAPVKEAEMTPIDSISPGLSV